MTTKTSITETERICEYVADIRGFKESLFALYDQDGYKLVRKIRDPGGSTWGYRLMLDNSSEKTTGSSMGEDEIKLFYDICHIIKPSATFVVGHAFGMSTFCLATAWPQGKVIAIDNWSEGEHAKFARDLTFRIIRNHALDNVVIHTGSSPQDTPAALAGQAEKLSLVFIDGLHTDEAAYADFQGVKDRLGEDSVVLWHNVDDVPRAFERAYAEFASRLFDQHSVLRTHGPIGIFYNSRTQSLLHTYLQDLCLIWENWEVYHRTMRSSGKIQEFERLRKHPIVRIVRRIERMLKIAPSL